MNVQERRVTINASFLGGGEASFLEMSCASSRCQMEMISNIKIEIVIVGKVRGITQKHWEKAKTVLAGAYNFPGGKNPLWRVKFLN